MEKFENLREIVERVLPDVIKPMRYVGGELNIIRKDPALQKIKVCLAFPDVYDIGQSYMGFFILYNILNKRRETLCERTFSPWTDMEEIMRREKIPLWSLESFLPVSKFDVVGFTLQYELHYPTILNMLDLAGIPFESSARGEDSPLVIAGGTCCANPEPVADFFDAILLGDGEQAFPEILDVVEKCKQGGLSRKETLLELAGIESVYVPSLYRVERDKNGQFAGIKPLSEKAAFPVISRIVEELKPEYYPDNPLVPACEVVHDRLAIEIMRGCSRGCRFCGAGMIYRPKRVRPVEDIVRQAVTGINSTGWEDVSLVSLSDSDYPGLDKAVKLIGEKLREKSVSLSLSSLRADNFSLSIAEAVAGGKKTGLTFAVEAASQRLRDVINKNLTEEQLFETVKNALAGGWNSFKLYFMIGLPTETDEDVIEIANLLNRLDSVMKQLRGGRINVTVSPYCPKPQTPFQWEDQVSVEDIERKGRLIRENLKARTINIKLTDPYVSMLENLLSRGGRELGKAVIEAWKNGCRLDGWSEFFNRDKWKNAIESVSMNIEKGGGGVLPGSPLPWSHLNFGIEESYLLKEKEKALQGKTTTDCSDTCHACGPYASFCGSRKNAAPKIDSETQITKKPTDWMFGRKKKVIQTRVAIPPSFTKRVRVKYGKSGAARFTGHLDLIRVFDRTLRRAEIPVAYSQGFSPHPKISFAMSLSLGMSSTAEYIDIILREACPGFETSLIKGFPEGFTFLGHKYLPEKAESLGEIIKYAEYSVQCSESETYKSIIADILSQDEIIFERRTKKGDKTVNLRPGIIELEVIPGGIRMLLGLEAEKSAKPSEVTGLIFGDTTHGGITRTEQYAVKNGMRVSPLEYL